MPRRSWLPYVFAAVAFLLGFRFLDTGCTATDRPPEDRAPTVLLISIDGFRWDYLQHYDAPTLRRLAAGGVHADRGMTAAFPTKTFPNHYSIVTGLYPDHHGIVANTMYDPVWDAWFRISDREAVADGRWWGGEPLWVTAEKQGQKAATYFWVGSEAPIGGTRPTYWEPYDGAVPNDERVDAVLGWLDLPTATRPTFLSLYFSHVDTQGHRYGPDAPETAAAVAAVDASLARLVAGLEARALLDHVNLVIVADHGMAATDPARVIAIDDYLDLEDVLVVDYSPLLMLRPAPDRVDAVFEALDGAHPHLTVYRKEDTPTRWRFRDHRRIPPVLALADEGWSIATERAFYENNRDRFLGGTHGYDNNLAAMNALFIAHGPAFRQGLTVAPFDNVHLYPLMASILGLRPAPNDGDLAVVRPMLAD